MLIYVLDACALLALIRQEAGADEIQNLLDSATRNEIRVYMSIVNLIEVGYDLARAKTPAEMEAVWTRIFRLPITFIRTISPETFHEAVRFKAAYKVSLGDVFGLAEAKRLGGRFVTADHHELEQIGAEEPALLRWFR
jgi:PIN domain nuclease of toxin-antitoxin system